MDRRPDTDARFRAGRRPARLLLERQRLAEAAQVLDGYDDLQLQGLASAGVDDCHAAALADTAQEPGDRLERALRRRQPDPLGSSAAGIRDEPLQALQAEGEMRAALRA